MKAREGLPGNLKRAREAAGLTQAEVAEKLGVHTMAVSHWERGRNTPTEENLSALAGLYGTTASQLRYGAESGPRLVSESGPAAAYEKAKSGVERSLGVRTWRDEFRLELTKAEVPDELVQEAIDLVTSPQVFTFYAGGAPSELSEEDAIKGMEALADVVRFRLLELGYKGLKKPRAKKIV